MILPLEVIQQRGNKHTVLSAAPRLWGEGFLFIVTGNSYLFCHEQKRLPLRAQWPEGDSAETGQMEKGIDGHFRQPPRGQGSTMNSVTGALGMT